ncbi:hypothetical protein C9426_34635 [Serratia sp. S1B]|nr:hypothetical protein C9426_34635 [Serratia sp. S1B]
MLRDAKPGLVFSGTLAGKNIHLVVQDCAVYKIDGEAKNGQLSTVFELESALLSFCDRQFLRAENGTVTVWLGRMAFGAGGCCITGGNFRTTDGLNWKKISQNASPY